jgi:hypothetical protein
MKLFIFVCTICFFVVIVIYFCDNKQEEAINFAKIELLLKDSSLSNICISIIPSNNKYRKFIFVHHGEVYTIKKSIFQTNIYGNEFNESSPKDVLKDFNYYLNILNSKRIEGSCLSIDSTLILKVRNFDVKELHSIDTLNLHKNFQYICMTTKDIRLSFVHHEYSSDLFFRKPIYFYYSNK